MPLSALLFLLLLDPGGRRGPGHGPDEAESSATRSRRPESRLLRRWVARQAEEVLSSMEREVERRNRLTEAYERLEQSLGARAEAAAGIKFFIEGSSLSSNTRVNSLLNHVNVAYKSLILVDETNMKHIADMWHSMMPLVTEFMNLNKNTEGLNDSTNLTRPVTISSIMILTQLLQDKDCPSPMYNEITESDGRFTACCIFYPCQSSSDYTNPIEIYGFPSWERNYAKESAALRALQYIDSDLEIKILDYSYQKKELEIDRNRMLLKKKKTRFDQAVFDARRLFSSQTTDLVNIASTLKANIASLPTTELEHISTFQIILDDLKHINIQLNAFLTKAFETLDSYDTPSVTRHLY